jgi:uncharacterized membrane protein
VFFGVTVRPDFRRTDVARACLRWYRVVLLGAVAATIGLSLTISRAVPLAALLISAVSTGAWLVTRRRVLPYAVPSDPVRHAVLTPRDTVIPGGVLILVGPFVIVALGALVVLANWDAIPARIPTLQRGSDRTVAKTATAVFQPFVFTGALLVAFTAQTQLLMRRTRQIAAGGPSLEAERRFKRRTALYSVAATYLMATGPTAFATWRVLGADGPTMAEAVWIAAVVGLSAIATIWMLRDGQGGQRKVPEAAAVTGDATPDTAWKGGLLYFNPADSTVFVERRMGVGWSLNFGSVWAWVLLGLGVGLPMMVLWLMR